jgi:hypothetical protein
MAIEDYIPDFFAGSMPQYLPGLLGENEAAALQSRAKVQGLLGAALTLAQGMNTPRTSAAQNIIGALAGGLTAGQGAYQGATQNLLMQQKIAESMLEREKAKLEIEGRKKFAEMYPNLAPIAAINPTEAAKIAGEIESFKPIQEIFSGGQAKATVPTTAPAMPIPAQPLEMQGAATSAPVMPPEVSAPTTDKVLPQVPVEAKASVPQVADLMRERDRLIAINSQLRGVRGGNKYIEENNKSLEAIDKQLGAYTTQSFDFQTFKGMLPEQFRPMADNLESLAYSGAINPKDLNKEIADISKSAYEFQQKQADYTNEVRRVAASMFPNKQLNQLTPVELAQLDEKLQAKDVAARKAGAASVNVAVTGEKKMAEKRAEGAVKAEDAAFSAMSAAGDVRAIVDILKPYRGGPIQSFQAQIGAYFPGTAAEKLASASQVAESIRQRIAPTIRVEGSGATSDFEARSYLNAIPNLMNTAEGRELMATYAEKLANRAAAAADIRARMVSEGDFSVRRFQEELKKQGLMQVFTPEELKILRGESSSKANPSIAPGVTVRRVK